MSNQVNTDLLEAAQFYQEEWAGTVMEGILAGDIAREDWDALYKHVEEARKMSFERDYHPETMKTGFNDVY